MNFPCFILGYKISALGRVSPIILDELYDGDEIVTIEPHQVKDQEQIDMMKANMFQRWLHGKLPKPIELNKNINQESLVGKK